MDRRAATSRAVLRRRSVGVVTALTTPGRVPSWWLPVLIAAAGLLVAGGAASAWATCPCAKLPPDGEAARLVTGLSFVGVGLIAMKQRRRRRVGLLMAAVGLTWFVYDLGWVYEPLTYTIGTVGAGLYQPILAHLTVVFPSGRTTSRVDRTVVAGAYALYAIASLGTQTLWDPRDTGCPCPANLLLLHHDSRLYAIADATSSVLLIVVTAAVLGVLVWHWRRSGLPGRRALTPVLASSLPIAALVVATTIVGENFLPPLAALALTALPLGFLAGLVRLQLERAALGSLVMELEGDAPIGRIRDALARTLHDRTLEVAYWMPSEQGYIDAEGRPFPLPAAQPHRSVTLLNHLGQPVAALIHDAAVYDNPDLVDAAAAAARLAIDNERLQAEIRAQLEQVRRSRARIVATADAERRRIERDLHDGAQQRLVTLSLLLGLARDQAASTPHGTLVHALDEAADELRSALAELRELARGIHPAVLSEAGLKPAIEALAERLPVAVVVSSPGTRFDAAVEAAAYFVAAEALTNAVKHAQASMVRVTVTHSAGCLTVEVVDDGAGGADPSLGSGLVGLADRVGALAGRLEMVSERGHGTHLTATIPCPPSLSPTARRVGGVSAEGATGP
ncbi:MAG: histidine kinase [Candidatus Dormibacter sp.]